MTPKSKMLNFLVLVVMISMIVTTVSAQPNMAPARKVSSDIVTKTNISQPEPPEPKQMLTGPYVSEPASPANTQGLPLASSAEQADTGDRERVLKPLPRPRFGPRYGVLDRTYRGYDPVVQMAPGRDNMPLPSTNWEGIANTVGGPIPPDTDGQVGPNHYVQIVNASGGSRVRVWDKVGTELYDFGLQDLWPTGDPCYVYAYGDPIVLYDQMADRWLLTQFALPDPPYYECIAVSKTGVPADNPDDWWLYSFLVHNTKMNDYPKFGVWPDGYYMSVNQFDPGWAGAGAFVFDRDAMLNGDPATFQYFDLTGMDPDYGGLLPSNLMDDTLPPTDAPNYFVSVDMDWDGGSDDIMHVFEFHTDWISPANSTFSLVSDLVVAPFDWGICPGGACIHQPDGAPQLDDLSDRLMMHLWYRNFGDHESLVVNHTVDVSSGRAGLRWYELRGGTVDTTLSDVTIYQQGTYAPDDTEHRWMGSIAMDGAGNIALGYSVSSVYVYPSIRYTGRQAGDPLGTLPEAETEIIAGSGSQLSPYARWGDYSAMSVDPADDCTFWYTQEYVETTGGRTWQTRVASFQFPSCSPEPKGILTGVVSDSVTFLPLDGVKVQAVASPTQVYNTISGVDGTYSMLLITGTYTLTASAYGYQPATITSVDVVSGATTVQDIALTPSAMYIVDGTVTDAAAGWPLYAHIIVRGDPVNPSAPYDDFWTDPATGYYSITLAEGITYTFEVETWATGYDDASRVISPLTANATEDFALTVDQIACTAPGYVLSTQFTEDFEGGVFPPTGWSVYNLDGGGMTWVSDTVAHSGNASALHDYGDPGVVEDGWLVSPAFTPLPDSDLYFWEYVAWASYYYSHTLLACTVDCGSPPTNYTEIAEFDNPAGNLWTRRTVDLSAYDGVSTTLAFRYMGDWADTWWIDDIVVPVSCDLQAGGFVVGNAYDGNTGDGLTGVEVANDSGYMTTAVDTSQDPAVDDGFYSLFSPAGSHTFTATMALYTADVQTPTVPLSDTVRQDFILQAGVLSYAPSALEIVLPYGAPTATLPLTLTNDGTLPATFDFDIPVAVMSQGFEDGVMPPAGWSVINAPTSAQHWTLVNTTDDDPEWIHSGDYAGWVNYEAADQDEWLISPEVDLGTLQDPMVEFWVYANNYWVAYAELQFLVIDSGGTFTDILWQQSGETWPYPSAYYQVQVDLSAYTTPVYLAWRYVGNDGDSIALDDILVTGVPVLPWLSMTPSNGTVPASSDQVVDAIFDAGVPEITQPGEYHAELGIMHDTPYDVPNLPVTMTVTPPATWGKLMGGVSSLGYCDVNPAALEGAEVLIEGGSGPFTPTTDADGDYVYWLDAGSYTVTVSAADHVGDSAVVNISAQMTTTRDFDLRSIEPCISVTPLSMEAALELGQSESQTLLLTNDGAGASTFDIQEAAGVLLGAPMAPTADWIDEDPTSGTIAADSSTEITVTFTNLASMSPGTYDTALVITTQDAVSDVVMVPVTITIAPRPEPVWSKSVYVNGVMTDVFPVTVYANDVITVVDQVWITYTGNITFTLEEEWTESLSLGTYEVRALPGGTVVIPTYGTVVYPNGVWTLMVTDAPSDWGYVVTKTFTVLEGDWETDTITETLTVEGAYPQPPDKVLQFEYGTLGCTIYLPLVVRSY